MRQKQMGFTLVEIAIVLVIIGLLLGGVLKGQELINSAKVKNFANDFRNIPLFIYGYQDRFRALPGDDPAAATHVAGATTATTPTGTQGNGVINGSWDSVTNTDESFLFWQHVRLANFASGPTNVADADYRPRNADGGFIGIEAGSAAAPYIAAMTGGSYVVCSSGILGRFAMQLDQQVDDGNTFTGSMRAVPNGSARGAAAHCTVAGTPAACATAVDPAASYTVCMAF